jgi:hypothetical protein
MQTQYDLDTPIGVEGQLIEAYPEGIITGIAEAGVINVGKLVLFDSTAGRANRAMRAPASSGDVTGPAVAGIAMWDPSYPEPPYRQYATFPVLRKGRILLACETIISKAIRPFVRYAAGTGTVLGSIRNDVDTSTAVAAPYLTVITPATAIGGLVVVEINL